MDTERHLREVSDPEPQKHSRLMTEGELPAYLLKDEKEVSC